jgi:hypothetical protein
VSRGLRSRSRKVGGCLPGQGPCSTGDPIAGLLSRGRERDLPGFQAIHPVPLPRSTTPAESTFPRLFDGFVDAAPAQTTAKASASWLYRGYRGASAPVAYASRMVLPPSMQGSLPAGWLAFTGRELNPLDRNEGFQITSSSSLPGLFLAQRPITCISEAIKRRRPTPWRCDRRDAPLAVAPPATAHRASAKLGQVHPLDEVKTTRTAITEQRRPDMTPGPRHFESDHLTKNWAGCANSRPP